MAFAEGSGSFLSTPVDMSTGTATRCNVGDHLALTAARSPNQVAVIWPTRRFFSRSIRDQSITFSELDRLANRYANGLCTIGVRRGMRVLVMVRPGRDFVAVMYALFRIGAVPVLIDPGMGAERLLECAKSVDVEALIGVPAAQFARILHPTALPSLRCVVTVGRRWFWRGSTLDGLARSQPDLFAGADTTATDVAAILFTSGSTGPPKGVVYEHGMFDAQIRSIQAAYQIEPGEVDLAGFAPFGLFSIAMGMTCVVPDMDPGKPASVDPERIVRAIQTHRATSSFGSPALWDRVSSYCLQRGITLSSLRRVLMAGAPAPWRLVDAVRRVLPPDAEVYTPYGATEAMPISSISGKEVLNGCHGKTRAGAGTCVGESLPGVDVTVMRITDGPVSEWSDDLLMDDGQIGEIAVAGPVVTREYFRLPTATAGTKIHECDTFWHRMGDVGYLDAEGRLWYCGRKEHRVVTADGTLYTDPCEAVFNEHPDVHRSALVGVGPAGAAVPVIVIEPQGGRVPTGDRLTQIRRQLLDLAKANPLTQRIEHVLFHPVFPVDARHNIKINRESLAQWAAKQLA